jgi:hypothetical protein
MTDNDARSYADERRRILVELERERKQLTRNIETCRIRDINNPLVGDWSLKDIAAHVGSWEAETVFALKQFRKGQRPALFDFNSEALDEWNQEHVERLREVDFFAVLQRLEWGRERLLEQLSYLDDETVGAEGTAVHNLLKGVIKHDRDHWREIAARLAGMTGVRPDAPQPPPIVTRAGS